MSHETDLIAGRYARALESYFETGDEAALSVAYELGRQAIGEGLGVLDMVSAHQQVVEERVLRTQSDERSQRARRAGDFLRETLSPFEMTFRGYKEANHQLHRLNQELARQRDAVEMVNRELESFSYSVSHDLRAPLRSIDGFSRALLESCSTALDDEGKRYLGHVRASAQEMSQLIDDLLKLARVTQAEITRAEVDISELSRQIGARLLASDPQRRVELLIQDRVRAVGDAGLVGVLMENLMSNAWKFTARREVARIEVGCRERNGAAEYFVRDNGAGFDMAYAAKLFGAFQRLHAKQDFDGTGIGLATVRRVALRHGGRTWAEGEVDRGATFYFTLETPRGES